METSKKLGIVVITLSIVLAIAFLVFSKNQCYATSFGDSWADMVFNCLEFKVFQRTMYNISGEVAYVYDEIYIPLKYLLFACVLIMAAGVLWYKGAIPAPKIKK